MKIFFLLALLISVTTKGIEAQINPKENFDKGIEAYYQGRFQDAIGYFDFYIQGYPSDYQGYMYEGLCYTSLGRDQTAVEIMGKAKQLQPFNAEVLTYLGYIKLFNDMTESAIEDFKKAVQSDLSNIHAIVGRGFAYMVNENYSAALTDFNNAESLQNPNYVNKALAYTFLSDSIKAWESFGSAIEYDPNNSLLSTNNNRNLDRNLTFMKVKIITIIIERINQSIKQYPDYFEYYLNRSFYYLSLRKIDLAEADVTKAKELHYYENPAFEELAKKIQNKISAYK